ncbi:cytochrome c3 family protein, partial [Effusibacillus lacus]
KGFRWLIGILGFLLLLLAFAPSSRAAHDGTHLTNSGPETANAPHGSFTSDTKACGYCHQLHRGKSATLLRAATKRDTCFLCHDGRGSKYDVKNGKTYIATGPNAGTIVDNAAGGFSSSAGFTSKHLIEEVNAPPGGNGQSFMLVCTSCHNPHGTPNHRLLRTTVNGRTNVDVQASVSVNPITNKETVSYKSGTANFCSSCHTDYVYYNREAGAIDKTKYRHPIGVMLNGGTRTADDGDIPKSAKFDPTLFTNLPTEGVPSGAYPKPVQNQISTGGSLSAGTYYYIVTAANAEGESHQGHVKTVSGVPANGKVTLQWDSVANALKYSVYRAGPSATPPTGLTAYNLVADSETQKSRFAFTDNPGGGTFTFEDTGAVQSTTVHPPGINSQANPAKVFCLTCHYAHGTKTVDGFTGESKLKRMDNMGVCQNCHKR